jgi:hypothetical protein
MQHPRSRIRWIAITCFAFWLGTVSWNSFAADLSDDQIRKILIDASIVRYPGSCPCPYFLDRAGRRCGARSAYSRQGGYSVLCYPQDVSEEMVGELGGGILL